MLSEFDFYVVPDGEEYFYKTGLGVEIKDDKVLIDTLQGYGDFEFIEEKIKTLSDLKMFIMKHYNEIDNEYNDFKYNRQEQVNELISFIDDDLKQVA